MGQRSDCLQVEQSRELLRLREHRIQNIDAEIGELNRVSTQRLEEANSLRAHLSGVLSRLAPMFGAIQTGASLAQDLGAVECSKPVLAELWDQQANLTVTPVRNVG